MTFVAGPVSVHAPASSANLGPGFDAFGLALTLGDTLTAEVTDGGLDVHVEGEGAADVPRDETHLVLRAMHAAFDLMNVRPDGIRLECRNVVPHARGLGSSSAAIVAGIALARELVVDSATLMDDLAAFQLATDLEGHPDNVAAAQFGGFTIAWLDGYAANVHRLDVSAELTVLVPPEPVSTELARGLLPETVPHRDAAANAGRAALLVAALSGAPGLLLPATDDLLHQSFRAPAMPASHKLMRALRVEGVPAVISGAGPTVLAFGRGVAALAPQDWAVHEVEVAPRGVHRVDTPDV